MVGSRCLQLPVQSTGCVGLRCQSRRTTTCGRTLVQYDSKVLRIAVPVSIATNLVRRYRTCPNVLKKALVRPYHCHQQGCASLLVAEVEHIMKTRSHGTGAIISRKGTKNLYIRYWQDGRQIQEAVGSDSRDDAEKMLRERIVDGDRGAVPVQDIKQLRYEDLRDSYLKMKPEQKNYSGLQHLDSFFKDKRIDRINADMIEDFIEHRREEDEVSDPTIRRNLVCLRAMFHLARKKGQLGLRDVPYFAMPDDSQAAGQYIAPEEFSKVLAQSSYRPTAILLIHVCHWLPFGCGTENHLGHGEQGMRCAQFAGFHHED